MQVARLNLNRSFFWSAASLALIALVLIVTGPTLLVAAFASSPDELQVAAALDRHLEASGEAIDVFQARFNGRSVFYTPPPTPRRPTNIRREPVVSQPEPEPEPRDTGPPPPPPSYTGPSIMAILGDEVWFVNPSRNEPPLRIKVGEENAGVEVLEVDPPWKARVRYRRGEYDVSLFELREFLTSEDTDTTVSPPPGLVEAPKEDDVPPAGQDAKDAAAGTSEKNSEEATGSGGASSKSDAGRADNTETPRTETGNRREGEAPQKDATPEKPMPEKDAGRLSSPGPASEKE